MARIAGGKFLMQQIGDQVVLFEEGTEREVVRYSIDDRDETAKAQKIIHDSPNLSAEEKSFAHFWSGYFYQVWRQ